MKTIKTSPLILLFAIIALGATGQGKVTVYTNDFNGSQYELGVGRYDYMTLLRAGITMVRSVKVPEGMKVTIYSKDNFEGEKLILTDDANMRNIQAKGFGQIVQNNSVVVEKLPTSAFEEPVIIYKDSYSGASKNLKPGYYDFYELGGVDNDQLSSVKVPKGMKVTLYEHKESGGRSLALTEDASTTFLVMNKFNDITSSIKVEKLPEPAPVLETPPVVVVTPPVKEETPAPETNESTVTSVTIYQDNFTGNSYSLEPGYYNSNQLKIGNDELSSVKLKKGMWALLFENQNFTGRSLLLQQNASADFIQGKEFDNVTSSIIIGDAKDPLPLVILFENDDFSGPVKKLTPGKYPVLERENDDLSSIEIPRGMRVTLFEDAAYKGRSMKIAQSVESEFLQKHQFDNVTSSLIIEQVHPRDLVVTIYEGSFSGRAQELTPGRYRARDIKIGGKTLSSVKVPPGMRVTLYDQDYFKGLMVVLDRNADYYKTKLFDNIYTSIIVEDVFEPIVTPIATPEVEEEILISFEPESVPVQVLEESPRSVYSYSTPCEPISSSEYEKALNAVKAKPFSDEKMATARLVTKDKCLSNEQIKGIATQFNFEEQTMEFVQYAYDYSSEKSLYYELDAVFKFMSSKEAFTKFLTAKQNESSGKQVENPKPSYTIPNTIENRSNLRKEAMDFVLKIIGSYFEQNCNDYYNNLSSVILTFESGPVDITKLTKEELCKNVPLAVKDKKKTFEDYIANYKLELLTRSEIEAKVGQKLPSYFNTTDEEFYFLGFEPKASTSEKFIWDEMFRFAVRKTDGVWKLKAPL